MRRWMSTGLILLFVVLALAVIWPGDAAEAAWAPNRPIQLVCPWAAGGGTDRIARMVAVLLEKELQQRRRGPYGRRDGRPRWA
jgi:tripartite-type tricarboxylate transporter receptor subunit TctC